MCPRLFFISKRARSYEICCVRIAVTNWVPRARLGKLSDHFLFQASLDMLTSPQSETTSSNLDRAC